MFIKRSTVFIFYFMFSSQFRLNTKFYSVNAHIVQCTVVYKYTIYRAYSVKHEYNYVLINVFESRENFETHTF
jgi:hypothetical protein